MTSAPDISVLIPAFNEEALIAKVIDSVKRGFADLSRTWEIVVCDNNSTDRTAEVAVVAGARVVFEPHNQIARARNSAARAAQGRWLIFLDGDTLLSPELLRETIGCFESGTVCGGGALIRFDREDIGPFARGLTRFWNTISAWCRLAAGSYLFCLREAWAETGGFDETLYASEEIAFSRSLKRWGRSRGLRFRILTSAPVITSARKLDWYGRWRLLGHVLWMARPGALKRRDMCYLWYKRPDREAG